jgi:[acyl-carrier-protein] S-malonyltransferase
MGPAAERMAERLAAVNVSSPEIPVVHNVDVRTHLQPEDIREALTRQLHSPVRWSDTIVEMVRQGVDRMVECGPGKVLVGLSKRIDKRLDAVCAQDPASLDQALSQTKE